MTVSIKNVDSVYLQQQRISAQQQQGRHGARGHEVDNLASSSSSVVKKKASRKVGKSKSRSRPASIHVVASDGDDADGHSNSNNSSSSSSSTSSSSSSDEDEDIEMKMLRQDHVSASHINHTMHHLLLKVVYELDI